MTDQGTGLRTLIAQLERLDNKGRPVKTTPPTPYTAEETEMLARHPDLVTQRRANWPRAAEHLDAADAARSGGYPCPWCTPPVRP